MQEQSQSKEEEKTMETDEAFLARLPNLPPEIIEDILSRAPVKSLLRFRSVSKSWLKLLSSDFNFIKKHLNQTLSKDHNHGLILQAQKLKKYYHIPNQVLENALILDSSCLENFGTLVMVGSCNGLICLSHHYFPKFAQNICIWNPAIMQCKTLPRPHFRASSQGERLEFCFDHNDDDYKVVRVMNFNYLQEDRRTYHIQVEIYSFNTNSWSIVGAFPYYLSSMGSSAVLNEFVHWVGCREEISGEHGLDFILCFDLRKKIFREVPLPNSVNSLDISDFNLSVFRGCLSMTITVDSSIIDVWLLKDCGVKNSWTKLFRVENARISYSIGLLKDGELLFYMDSHMEESTDLYSYNSESKGCKKIQIPGLDESFVNVAPYVESLVQPDATHNAIQDIGNQMEGGGNANYRE